MKTLPPASLPRRSRVTEVGGYSLRQALSWKELRMSVHCSLWLPLAAQEHQGPTLDVELSRRRGEPAPGTEGFSSYRSGRCTRPLALCSKGWQSYWNCAQRDLWEQ
ncbi:hypothetical protein EYF80_055377 [Liparis tanakae]|uniref:Uncharacterized protein n=1 Tax=Liparis tanakae TaxID=230148 RepID=A0A4Z2F0A3_9TELE|nr:hypothetical protein EYF80_055377 [Liparis tanakae]